MKYIFFDIDGTLTGTSRQITPKTIEAIRKTRANGNKVFLCTGRAPISIMKSIRDIGFDGVISSAGGFVEVDGKYIYENFINQYLLQEVILLFTNAKVLFTLETKDALYQSPGVLEFFDARHERDTKNNVELARFMEARKQEEVRLPLKDFDIGNTKVSKVCFIAKDKYSFLDTVPYLSEFFNVVTFSQYNDDFINGEIIIKNCTKADSLKMVVEYFNGDMKDTVAFGDSMNDYQMLETVNYSFASEIAPQKVKDIANDTFIDPDKDGIALALEKNNYYQ